MCGRLRRSSSGSTARCRRRHRQFLPTLRGAFFAILLSSVAEKTYLVNHRYWTSDISRIVFSRVLSARLLSSADRSAARQTFLSCGLFRVGHRAVSADHKRVLGGRESMLRRRLSFNSGIADSVKSIVRSEIIVVIELTNEALSSLWMLPLTSVKAAALVHPRHAAGVLSVACCRLFVDGP